MFNTIRHIFRLRSHIHLEINDPENNDVNFETAWPRIALRMLIQHFISNVDGLKVYIRGMNMHVLFMNNVS